MENSPAIDHPKLAEAIKLLPPRCALKCCSGSGIFIKPSQNSEGQKEGLLPLKKVDAEVKIEASFATCDIEMIYQNPSTDCALEATYQFHLERNTLLADLTA